MTFSFFGVAVIFIIIIKVFLFDFFMMSKIKTTIWCHTIYCTTILIFVILKLLYIFCRVASSYDRHDCISPDFFRCRNYIFFVLKILFLLLGMHLFKVQSPTISNLRSEICVQSYSCHEYSFLVKKKTVPKTNSILSIIYYTILCMSSVI